jgi:aspartyl-tRNA(Asn)/glutamyl-tRNA(Gln) amidotransferase subunit B
MTQANLRPSSAKQPGTGKLSALTPLLALTKSRVLMELGTLFKDLDFDPSRVPAKDLASIITHLQSNTITSRSARKILLMKFEGDARPVGQITEEQNMQLRPLSEEEYVTLAQSLLKEKPDMVRDILEKGQEKKIKWFVGQMMSRSGEGSVEPGVAEEVLRGEIARGKVE